MNILENPNDRFFNQKLVFKATTEFTDEQAEQVLRETEISSEEEILQLIGYLEQFRPELAKKLSVSVASK